MTPLFAARRAAEEFAQLVDAPVDRSATRTGTHGHRAGPHADLLPTVTTLREQTSVTPRAEFVAELRARLMVAADTALAPGPRSTQVVSWFIDESSAHSRRLRSPRATSSP